MPDEAPQPAASRRRFSLRKLLLAVSVVALLLGGLRAAWLEINGDGDEVAARFRSDPRVEVVSMEFDLNGIADTEKRVYSCHLRLAGRPDSCIKLIMPTLKFLEGHGTAGLAQLGEQRLGGRIDDPTRSWSSYNTTLSVGDRSPYDVAFPPGIHGFDDLVDRYDEILAAVRRWPDASQPAQAPCGDGRSVLYWTWPGTTNSDSTDDESR